jgi:hypothetical protein
VSEAPLLIANVGAEEGPDWQRRARQPAARTTARLWRKLFGQGLPAFDWLPARNAAVAWLNTEQAAQQAASAGRVLAGAHPHVVRRVHDKAFAHEVACREGLVPDCLAETSAVFTPEELRAVDAISRLEARIACWPAWARERFTLKPRLAASGRGRVAGLDGCADTAAVRGALPRLAQRGGALLEPWLERCEDLSAQLLVAEDGSIRLLGTTQQVLEASGLYRGARGEVDARGRVSSGSRHDGPVREAAAALTRASAAEGHRGPCGLDAFAFRGPAAEETLRPVVEFNARYTVGHLAIACVRRALAALDESLGLPPGELRAFHFGLDAPAGGWPPPGPGLHFVALGEAGQAERPGLLFARCAERLEAALTPQP